MPFIIHGSPGGQPIVNLNRFRSVNANAGVIAGLEGTLVRARTMFADGGTEIPNAADLVRTRTLYALLRLGSEPNVFGSGTFARTRALSVEAGTRIGGKAILPRVRDLALTTRVNRANSDTLNIFLTIADDTPAGYGNTYSARVYADGVAYAIKAFNYTEDRGDVGVSLELTLVKPTDRPAIEAAASFRFDIYDGGTWITLFDSGKRTGIGFGFTFGEGRPADALSLTTNGAVDNKLRKSPDANLTVYDSARVNLTAGDFQTIYDTDGNAFTQTLFPIVGLDLYSLLQYVFVTKCGFTGYRTTLPNYPIRRADFSITGTFFDGIAGHVGAFTPLLFVKDDVVWLIDSTASFPAGFGSPSSILASEYINAQFSQTDTDIDAYIVQFGDTETNFDYQVNRFVVDDPIISGDFGSPNYTETTRTRNYVDYFKTSNPIVPVRTEKVRDRLDTVGNVAGVLVTIATETETLVYDTFGNIQSIEKIITGLVPDLSDAEFPTTERTIKTERTRFSYGPDRITPARQILKLTKKETSGLITIDTENQHIGKPFKQEFADGLAAGNLSEAMVYDVGSIETYTETIDQNDKGQIEVRTRRVNFLTDPPHITPGSTTDARAGDLSTNSQTGATREIVVFRPGSTRTSAKMAKLAVAELPAELATPLARRKLAKRKIRRGNVTLKGLKLAIGRGTMFEIFDRDGNSAGDFVCEGRSIAGVNLGTANQSTRQVLEVSEL